jgi:LPS-assembly protein
MSVDCDTTQFQADPTADRPAQRQRSVRGGAVEPALGIAAGFITPKLQLHATNYQFNARWPTARHRPAGWCRPSAWTAAWCSSATPVISGARFARRWSRGRFMCTRRFATSPCCRTTTPGRNDFNFASIYTENAFLGNDRIADSNLLTLGVSTRLLDPDTGAEAARFGIAQRVRFKDQRVTLPGGAAVAKGFSDVLVGASINLDPRWAFDSTVQFNADTGRSIRSTIGGRYSPGNYRVISAAYRLQRESSEQLDIGWQWPINDLWGDRGEDLGAGRGQGEGRWYSVGRINFSLREGKLVDSVIGLEYDGGCWLGRVVLERLQTGASSANRRIMFQLEFVGFSRLGANPLQTLKQNIPRYQFLRETTTSPGRFSNYE